MKKHYTFLLVMLMFSISTLAQHPNFNPASAGIRVEVPQHLPGYILMMNGRQINRVGFLFAEEGLPAGRHHLQTGYFTGHGRYRRFVTFHSIYVDLFPGQRLLGRLNGRGQFMVAGYENLFPPQYQIPVCPPVTHCPPLPHFPPAPQCPPMFPHQQNWPQHPRPQQPNHPFGGWGNIQPMSAQDFQQLINTVSNRSFESDKLLISKQALKDRYLSTAQIAQLMNLYSFESTKLAFAKYAFDFCADPQNYYTINDAFTFSGSINSLEQYISRR
jgi:hypothetical protein